MNDLKIDHVAKLAADACRAAGSRVDSVERLLRRFYSYLDDPNPAREPAGKHPTRAA
jgi:hypothetical protein